MIRFNSDVNAKVCWVPGGALTHEGQTLQEGWYYEGPFGFTGPMDTENAALLALDYMSQPFCPEFNRVKIN